MFSMYGRSRPDPLSLNRHSNQPTASPTHLPSSMQANFKPDFIASRPTPTEEPLPNKQQIKESISQKFQRTHADIIETFHLGSGPLTEKQRHDHNWGKREDPRSAREQTLQNQQSYAAHQKLLKDRPVHPVNYTGPTKHIST